MRGGGQVMPLTFIVKRLIIANVAIWFVFVLVLQNLASNSNFVFEWFGFHPLRFYEDFWVWQPFTYMFLHSANVFHVVFNMLLLWWLGSELEIYWGRRYFLFYYLTCGVGAALIYMLSVFIYYLVTGNAAPLMFPVVGASGAIFGLILAYGLILFAFQFSRVSYIAPAHEVGIVIGVVFGTLLLREPFGKGRIIGSCLIIAGLVLISLAP